MSIKFEPVIGLEIHVQLASKTKMFCTCPNGRDESAGPNSEICPRCSGQPGTLPVMNNGAVRLGVRAGLALGCQTNPISSFERKHYFYPDLPKGYQITQNQHPVNGRGEIEITFGPKDKLQTKKIGIHHAHLEEDAAKSTHCEQYSLVDYNRAGAPLLEIVSMPDMRSADEAYAYLTEIKRLMQWVDASNCDMEKGELRVDVNVSLRPEGTEKFGTRTEIKNLNSFKAVKDAINFEIARQTELLNKGEKVIQQTLLWDKEQNLTKPMRSKEDALDYRYFPEPDLPSLVLSDEWLAQVKAEMPQLPREKEAKFKDLGLSAYDAGVLTLTRATAAYFEHTIAAGAPAKAAANWITTDLMGLLHADKKEIEQSPVSSADLAGLIALVEAGKISRNQAKGVFEKMYQEGGKAEYWVEKLGLSQVSDEGQLFAWAQEVIDESPKAVADFKKGNRAAVGALVGAVMRKSKGKANPKRMNEILVELLSK